MQVRRPYDPDEEPSPPPPPVDAVSYRVPTGVLAAKLAVATVVALAGLLTGERLAIAVSVLVALALCASAVRDLAARERLRADAGGIDVVRGFASRRHLAWDDIEAIRVDERLRLGVRSQLLEVDADAEIYLFSRYDLGTDPAEALTTLNSLAPPAPPTTP